MVPTLQTNLQVTMSGVDSVEPLYKDKAEEDEQKGQAAGQPANKKRKNDAA